MKEAVDRLHTQIQGEQKSAEVIANKLRRSDPLSVLPLEVFGRIIEIGVADGDPDFALRPSWVSKRWREAVIGTPTAWKSFQCEPRRSSQAKCMAGKAQAWHERSKGRVEEVRIVINRDMDMELSSKPAVVRCFSTCTSAWLLSCRKFSLHGDMKTAARVCNAMQGQNVSQLQELHAGEKVAKLLAPPNLRVLDITRIFEAGSNPADSLPGIQCIRRLQRLTLNVKQLRAYHQAGLLAGMTRLEELRVRHLPDDQITCRMPNCPYGLFATGDSSVPAQDAIRFAELKVLQSPPIWIESIRCPSLSELRLGPGCSCDASATTTAFSQNLSGAIGHVSAQLETLVIDRFALYVDVPAILPRMVQLKHLNIKRALVRNDSIEAIMDAYSHPNLEEVVISDARDLTGTPLMRMVSNRIKLQTSSTTNRQDCESPRPSLIRHLRLSNCDVLEKEAEEWLKRNVPDCQIQRIRPAAPTSYRDRLAA